MHGHPIKEMTEAEKSANIHPCNTMLGDDKYLINMNNSIALTDQALQALQAWISEET